MNEDIQSGYNAILNELYHTINLLYYSVNIETKNSLLQRLEEQISRQTWLFNQVILDSQISAEGVQAAPVQGIAISRSELSKYDGKNGNPAYVAVNGVVYDVTNNAAWAAASHFGLSAGKYLTGAHASCHASQDVLSKLKAVGRLDDGVTQL